jgi:hypothetical protein
MFVVCLTIVATAIGMTAAPTNASWGWPRHRGSSGSSWTGRTRVPEPGDIGLFAFGVAGLIAGRRSGRR